MKISPINNFYKSFPKNVKQNSNSNNIEKTVNSCSPAFKSLYIENNVDLGNVCAEKGEPKFLAKDYYMLNEIANLYPYQDCFIRCGNFRYPRLEFREKPPEVQVFNNTISNQYKVEFNPKDKDYPIVPLLLYDDDISNTFIGLPSYISINPSLPYTVKAGYELHKKMIEKKYEILELIGKNDESGYDIGDDTIMERAHKEIEDIELAVTRYLLEAAYAGLTDKQSAKQLYASEYPKIQSRLTLKRMNDLTTSVAKQDKKSAKDIGLEERDICEFAMKHFPDSEENRKAIKKLKEYMFSHNITL
ncbi:hypothetical protein IJ182_06340 [bacterium]|nr:hypothetical protein [bacterium]